MKDHFFSKTKDYNPFQLIRWQNIALLKVVFLIFPVALGPLATVCLFANEMPVSSYLTVGI